MKRTICALLALVALLCTPISAADKYTQITQDCRELILSDGSPLPGDEWAVIALALGGQDVPQAVFSDYLFALAGHLAAKDGKLSANKYTEYARTALALAALGEDPRAFAGFDLLAPLEDYDAVIKQGVNGPIWALIALDCLGLPEQGGAARTDYIEYILSRERESGGFALTGDAYDIDVTAMAALALFRCGDAAYDSARAACDVLAGARKDGYYLSLGKPACESAAQAVIAMCALDMPHEQTVAALDALMRFYIAGEGFAHTPGGGADRIATVQALLALSAYARYERGDAFIYDMSGVLPAVCAPENIAQAPVFSDISERDAGWPAVYALARRGIISGFEGGEFRPERRVTRAELAAMLSRALGLQPGLVKASDAPDGAWYSPFVNALATYGLIERAQPFRPNDAATRGEAYELLSSAYALCGSDAQFDAPPEASGTLSRLEAAELVYALLSAVIGQ